MSIGIIEGWLDDEKRAVLVCTTSGTAFGPVFDDEEHAERAIEACTALGVDPRAIDEAALRQLAGAVATITITKDSHRDHGIVPEIAIHLLGALARARKGDDRGPTATTIVTVTLPPDLGLVPCALYGPSMGDEPVRDAFFARRGARAGESRMVRAPIRNMGTATAIAGQHEGRVILYTAFGGPLAPREPWDPSLTEADREASAAFWAEHALATGAA